MDPRRNPYTPGAGTLPPELAGRDDIIERAAVALYRTANGRAAQSLILYGLRGVGKTVLLRRIRLDAEIEGYIPVGIEAPKDHSLSAIIRLALRATLSQVVDNNAGFESIPGLADSGDLEADMTDLLQTVGEIAAACGTAVVLFIDELQYTPEEQLAALISALHSANQRRLPIILVAAGLPQLLGQMGQAKPYAERLFEFVPIGPLDPEAARQALSVPAEHEDIQFEEEAIEEIINQTEGYPYFLQEWGKHAWSEAEASPITHTDIVSATGVALAELDARYFRVRYDRLTPAEQRYMRAMAELGPGPYHLNEVADLLGKENSAAAPVCNRLIGKGMVYNPAHGDIAFTVPLFDGFMRRIMPDFA